jgi:glycosyltransferase involved in cell wall biosynthesis
MIGDSKRRLRVAFVVGTLGQGGAEKQLVYWVRALTGAGVAVRVCCLTRGEFFEGELRRMGVSPIWIGRRGNPVARIGALARTLMSFRPHVVQSVHFYGNLYACSVAPLFGAMAIGSVRNDTFHEMSANGRWGRWLLHLPPALITNSHAAKHNAESLGVDPAVVRVMPNVIDLAAFDRIGIGENGPEGVPKGHVVVAAVARHAPEKRLERFVAALARARRQLPSLSGVLIGSGPESGRLQGIACDLGLLPDGLRFLGHQPDVARPLHAADIFLLTSDHEGFPNAILEAMAARLPVITTDAGDAGLIVQHGVTGYVVPNDDISQMAECILRLARSPDLRAALGNAGRRRVEQLYSFNALPDLLLRTYHAVAEGAGRDKLVDLVPL